MDLCLILTAEMFDVGLLVNNISSGGNMDLKCRKLDCKYNKLFSCTRKGIKVVRNRDCSSYEKAEEMDSDQKQKQPQEMFSDKPTVYPCRHVKNLTIACDAKCLFNREGICFSNGISIIDLGNASCGTFLHQ